MNSITHHIESIARRTQSAAATVIAALPENHGLTARELWLLWEERKTRRYEGIDLLAEPLALRLKRSLLARYAREISRRGGETEVGDSYLRLIGRRGTMCLIGADGWRQYSRAAGDWRASLRYLCGIEDGRAWATRVAGTCDSVADAIRWLEPAEVRRAKTAGRRVIRQGDIYALEMRRDRAAATANDLPDRHEWDTEARIMRHPEHVDMQVPWPAKFVSQRTLGMGRGGSWGCGD